jgi:hypothetical protein
MDYDLVRTVEGKIEYNLDQAMPYGDFAPSMLMSRFEETDIGPDEDAYDDYARTTLTDWTPDQNKFEHEEARGGVNRRSGRIQLQYYGHRGDADSVYRPEIFDGFMGDEDRDPRGSQVDPDMKELRKQHDSRMRFVRFTPDGADHVTGGGRSEAQVMADQQKLFRVVRNRLKVFDRQIDGRRNGMRRTYKHKSNVPKQILVQSYGDFIKDYALNPQRRANVICKEILRNTRGWYLETMDADFAFARYSQICRRQRTKTTHNRVRDYDETARRNEIDDDDTAKHYKAVGLLMSNIINGKKQAVAMAKAGNMDFDEARNTVQRKTSPFERDLTQIMRAMTQDSEFSAHHNTMVGKTPCMVQQEHLMRQIVHNHILPAQYYLNAEIMYKSVKPGADTRKVKDLAITDANSPELRDMNTTAGKTAKRRLVHGAKLAREYDADHGESVKTFNYRTANFRADHRKRSANNDQNAGQSDDSQHRRPLHTNYRNASSADVVDNIRYGDNTSKERHTGALGSKYLNRHIDRDSRGDEISLLA